MSGALRALQGAALLLWIAGCLRLTSLWGLDARTVFLGVSWPAVTNGTAGTVAGTSVQWSTPWSEFTGQSATSRVVILVLANGWPRRVRRSRPHICQRLPDRPRTPGSQGALPA